MRQLEKLNSKIRNCKKCPLWKTRKNAVPGEGPTNAKIMILGQAPGAMEDKTGKPFVGRAGKFLNQLLELAKIKREKPRTRINSVRGRIFITSPVKCFPPKNRKPTKKEVETCLPYLKRQIEIINPRKIILLGEIAFRLFFPNEKLKDFRGKWATLRQAQGKKKFFVTYHPAAGLRFPKIKKILEKDFKKLTKDLKTDN